MERLILEYTKEQKETIKKHAKKKGLSMKYLIWSLVEKDIEKR